MVLFDFSSSKSINENINEFVTNITNSVTNNYKSTAQSTQRVEIGCTDEQFKLAQDLVKAADENYTEIMKAWITAVGTNPALATTLTYPVKSPPTEYCSTGDINMTTTVMFKADAESKTSMETDLKKELSAFAAQANKEIDSDQFKLYDNKKRETINTIRNNTENILKSNLINDTVNAAISDQTLIIDGMKVANINLTSTVKLISDTIATNILKDVDKIQYTTAATQQNSLETKNIINSAGEAGKDILTGWGNIISSATGPLIGLAVLAVIGLFFYLKFMVGGGDPPRRRRRRRQRPEYTEPPMEREYTRPRPRYTEPPMEREYIPSRLKDFAKQRMPRQLQRISEFY